MTTRFTTDNAPGYSREQLEEINRRYDAEVKPGMSEDEKDELEDKVKNAYDQARGGGSLDATAGGPTAVGAQGQPPKP